MENLTNEQIVDIINFYKLCGISEDMYLSQDGVKDLFSLLGIVPEYDEDGNRLPTVYEQLSIAPKFRDGKEVPIVFSIKHKASKIGKSPKIDSTSFKYVGEKESVNDKAILNRFKQDYFSAISNGNMVEATRLYDLIDMMTGGKADFFIGVQYNCVKFYKKMQKQLLIDMFANFVILMILSKKQIIKEGLIKFDKLYKSFVEHELKNENFGLVGGKETKIPQISSISVSIDDNYNVNKISVKATAKPKKDNGEVKQINTQSLSESFEKKSEGGFINLIKSKVTSKINKIKDSLSEKQIVDAEKKDDINLIKSEKTLNILEND